MGDFTGTKLVAWGGGGSNLTATKCLDHSSSPRPSLRQWDLDHLHQTRQSSSASSTRAPSVRQDNGNLEPCMHYAHHLLTPHLLTRDFSIPELASSPTYQSITTDTKPLIFICLFILGSFGHYRPPMAKGVCAFLLCNVDLTFVVSNGWPHTIATAPAIKLKTSIGCRMKLPHYEHIDYVLFHVIAHMYSAFKSFLLSFAYPLVFVFLSLYLAFYSSPAKNHFAFIFCLTYFLELLALWKLLQI